MLLCCIPKQQLDLQQRLLVSHLQAALQCKLPAASMISFLMALHEHRECNGVATDSEAGTLSNWQANAVGEPWAEMVVETDWLH